MSSSTSLLDTLSASQAQKEVTANALFDAGSPATLFGRRASTSAALTWGYYGGAMWVDGVLTAIANGTVALTASSTNYVEATRAGAVSKNTTAFTPGRIPLYTIVTGTATVTSYTDHRLANTPLTGRLALSVAGGANVTLTSAQAANNLLRFAGLLTGNINVVVPDGPQEWDVWNDTTGAYTLTVKTNAGTGIAVTQGKSIRLAADGTNVVVAGTDYTSMGLGSAATATLDTDGTMAADSDTRVPSQKAVRTYVATAVTGLLDFKGATDCSTNPNYPAASKGDAYLVSVAGKIGGASGKTVAAGDTYIASADNAGGTEASVGTSWFVLETNLDTNNIDINGGAIDNTVIGGSSPAAVTATALTATGLFDISGASAGQVQFPATQNASANANTLDDYEEGSFTPAVAFGGASVGITGTQYGRYTKIGRVVAFQLSVTLTSKGSSTGTFTITGLPFTSSTDIAFICHLRPITGFTAGVLNRAVYAQVGASSTVITPTKINADGDTASVVMTDADVANTLTFTMNGVYYV